MAPAVPTDSADLLRVVDRADSVVHLRDKAVRADLRTSAKEAPVDRVDRVDQAIPR